MYILLSGAKKNAGDYLIFNRAKALLEEHLNEEFTIYKRWEKLDNKLDVVNSSKGVIICGGPGYGERFYPIIYPLTNPLEKIEVPIIPFGSGWSGSPLNMKEFRFTDSSIKAIREIHSNITESSVRDVLTLKILSLNKITNVVLSGCPAWYSLDTIDKDFIPPEPIKKIVITTPARAKYTYQTIRLFHIVKNLFPRARILCSFHRGIKKDQYIKKRISYVYRFLEFYARSLGFSTIDMSYGAEKLELYRKCDLHVGYRVHSHIYFLSIKKPSFLLHEDGRGKGLSLTIDNELDVSAFMPKALKDLKRNIEHTLENEFEKFYSITDFMKKKYYDVMLPFIENLK